MWRSILLLVPALVPSWRFFQTIEPSPRIEYRIVGAQPSPTAPWQRFRPCPPHVSVATMLRRLLWNPHWNESLFLTSCAERLINDGRDHARREILRWMRSDLADLGAMGLQFRLVVIARRGERLETETVYISEIDPPALSGRRP